MELPKPLRSCTRAATLLSPCRLRDLSRPPSRCPPPSATPRCSAPVDSVTSPALSAVSTPHLTASLRSTGIRSVILIMPHGMVASQSIIEAKGQRGKIFRDAGAVLDGIHRPIT